ncbi:MAG: DUF2961 domain-containing protein [Kiritimatiellales bacterium]|nr:DUF2961 domain-containing protein [Kiritimatiellales bacterium]
MTNRYCTQFLLRIFALLPLMAVVSCSHTRFATGGQWYKLDGAAVSRSISFENPTGAKGAGGKAASHLGVGRKGMPSKSIAPGEQTVLCDIEGSGTIRHIWITGAFKNKTTALRSMVVRAYWDDQEHPSIECPLGDFMGNAHATVNAYQSAVHSTGTNAALNIWIPMPFSKHAKLTLTNEGKQGIVVYYQIDYTIGEKHPADFGRLHTCFRRQNPTVLKQDFELLPRRKGKGRYLGAVLGIRTFESTWWGEGEIKMYIDGDQEFPTICGTGSEDYVCLSYGMQQTPFLYHGCSFNQNGFISMYRWHIPDPVYWNEECRITIQQIGWSKDMPNRLYERQDDWCCTTFWYEPIPSQPLPAFPDLNARLADLPAK